MDEERLEDPTEEDEERLVVPDERVAEDVLLRVVTPLADERVEELDPDLTLDAASPLLLAPARPVTEVPLPAELLSPRNELEEPLLPTLVRPVEPVPA